MAPNVDQEPRVLKTLDGWAIQLNDWTIHLSKMPLDGLDGKQGLANGAKRLAASSDDVYGDKVEIILPSPAPAAACKPKVKDSGKSKIYDLDSLSSKLSSDDDILEDHPANNNVESNGKCAARASAKATAASRQSRRFSANDGKFETIQEFSQAIDIF